MVSDLSETMTLLNTNLHLYTAAIEKAKIVVFLGYEMIGSGRIERVTEETVQIKGERYPKENCMFYAVR